MQLVPSTRPVGVLEPAPRSSLRAESADESWDGFWCVADDSYYARCTRSGGREQWFRIADEYVRVREDVAPVSAIRGQQPNGVGDTRRMLLLRRAKGQPILVGSLRRGARGIR